MDEVPAYDSTVNLIRELKEKNIPHAVISSSKNCVDILKRIGVYELLDAVVDGSRITKGKPDPQIFLMAAQELNVQPGDCVVFEDAVLGVEAAKNAGMYCIGIDRYDNPERLAKADKVLTDISEITLDEVLQLN